MKRLIVNEVNDFRKLVRLQARAQQTKRQDSFVSSSPLPGDRDRRLLRYLPDFLFLRVKRLSTHRSGRITQRLRLRSLSMPPAAVAHLSWMILAKTSIAN